MKTNINRILAPTKNEGGFALIISLLMMTILSAIGVAALNNTDIELQIAGNERLEKQIFYGTESGCRRGGQWLRNLQMVVVDEYVDNSVISAYVATKNFDAALDVHTVTDSVNPESNLGNGSYDVQYMYDIAETINSTGNRIDCKPIPGNNPGILDCFYDIECTSNTVAGGDRLIQIRVDKPTDFN